MEHEIVENERPVMLNPMPWPDRKLKPAGRTFRIRQCKYCGCSERYIEHFGRTECPHQSEGE